MDLRFILIPLISALIGWFTNYIAVKMIFRPVLPINFLFFKIQGLIPKRQSELANKIATVVTEELIDLDQINHEQISNDNLGKLSELVSNNISQYLNELVAANPMVSMFLNGQKLDQLKIELSNRIVSNAPQLISVVKEELLNKENLSLQISNKIKNFEFYKLEQIVYEISSTELKAIEYLGGIIGFLIGLIQVIILKF